MATDENENGRRSSAVAAEMKPRASWETPLLRVYDVAEMTHGFSNVTNDGVVDTHS